MITKAKLARLKGRYTMSQLTELTEIPKSTIQRIERGKIPPMPWHAATLSWLYGIPEDELQDWVNGEGYEKKPAIKKSKNEPKICLACGQSIAGHAKCRCESLLHYKPLKLNESMRHWEYTMISDVTVKGQRVCMYCANLIQVNKQLREESRNRAQRGRRKTLSAS